MDMRLMQVNMPDVLIPNGQQFSASINWQQDWFDAEAISIVAPAVMAETVTLQVSDDNVAWGDLADLTGTAIKGPQTAGQGIVYNGIIAAIKFMRLKASAPVAADRTFKLVKSFRC